MSYIFLSLFVLMLLESDNIFRLLLETTYTIFSVTFIDQIGLMCFLILIHITNKPFITYKMNDQ
jgi:hypothetical protein